MKRFTVSFDEFETIIIQKLSELRRKSVAAVLNMMVIEWIENNVEVLKEYGIDTHQLARELYEKKQHRKKDQKS